MFARPFCFRRCFVFVPLALLCIPFVFAGDDEDCESGRDSGEQFYDITQDFRNIHDGAPRAHIPEASMLVRYRATANTLTSLAQRKKFSQKLLTEAMGFMRRQLDSESVFYVGLTRSIDSLWFDLLNFFEYCFEQALRSRQQRAEFFSFYEGTLRMDAERLQELLNEVLGELQQLKSVLNNEDATRDIAEWMEVLKKIRENLESALNLKDWYQVRALLGLLRDFNGFVLAYAEQVPLWPNIEDVFRGQAILEDDQEAIDYDEGDDDSDELLREATRVHFNHTGTPPEGEELRAFGLRALLQEIVVRGNHGEVDLNAIFAALFLEDLDVNGAVPCVQ